MLNQLPETPFSDNWHSFRVSREPGAIRKRSPPIIWNSCRLSSEPKDQRPVWIAAQSGVRLPVPAQSDWPTTSRTTVQLYNLGRL